MLYDAIYKKGSKQIWVSVSLLSIFFLWNFTNCMRVRLDEEHNYKENMFIF